MIHGVPLRNVTILPIGLCTAAMTLMVCGCAFYRTPGAGVSLASLANVEEDIAAKFKREPAAPFPANMAVVRVQGPGYESYRTSGYGNGRFSVVTTRDMEVDADFDRLAKLPHVAGIAPLNRLIIPPYLNSDRDLRLAAATVKADLLLLYTVDTKFTIDEHDFGPLRLFSLGMLPTAEARVTATASAALFDVRTGFVYGLAEATAQSKQIASAWTSSEAVDQSRVKAEGQAFHKLLGEFEKTWDAIVKQYAAKAPQPAAVAQSPTP